ncbi:hypothetical protein [Geodermatophilus sp. CPCC 205761]|uniref:hypothetical protein n=1 Tax=Geodermatophilus sp. CPCC 205761 TaxID=2936597 RepID=UPI003EEFA6F0
MNAGILDEALLAAARRAGVSVQLSHTYGTDPWLTDHWLPGMLVVLDNTAGAAAGYQLARDLAVQALTRPTPGLARPDVQDPNLRKIVDALYKPGATVGNGSTADAVWFELLTGNPVKGKRHIDKAVTSINALQKWLDANPGAPAAEVAAARALIQDLGRALARDPRRCYSK